MSQELLITIRNRGSIAEITALLVEEDTDIDFQDDSGMSPLMEAVLNPDMDTLELLWAHNPQPTIDLEDQRGNTALNHIYLEYDGEDEDMLIESLNFLLARGANANHNSETEDTFIEWAAYNGHVNIVTRLLEVQATVGSAIEDARAGILQANNNEERGKYETIIGLLTAAAQPDDSMSSEVDDEFSARFGAM